MKLNRIELRIGTPSEFLFGISKTYQSGVSTFAIGILLFNLLIIFKR